MSLDTTFTRRCPYFVESDVLKLSARLTAKQTHLHDATVDARHSIHPPGDMCIHALCNGISYGQLRHMARKHLVTDMQLSELLGFLNALGGLRRHRRPKAHLDAVLQHCRALMLGVLYPSVAWRRPASFQTILWGTWRATRSVTVALCITGALTYVAGFASAAQTICLVVFSNALFVLSIVFHELTHLAIMQTNHTSADVLQFGLRLGLIHKRLTRIREICSAIAGPVGGAAYCLLVALACLYIDQYLAASIGACIAAVHLCGLLPFYGDGASLRNALKKDKT